MSSIKYIKHPAQHIGRGENIYFDKRHSICWFFEAQVRKTPSSIAVKFEDKNLTYEQLNNQSNQLANYLIASGLPRQSSVAIYLKPNLQLLVVILAILKTGGSYVPLDINYPDDRINFMLKDSESHFLITSSDVLKTLTTPNIYVVKLDQISDAINAQSITYHNLVKANSLAYIIYTSGSTGVPKGVTISHRAVNNHMIWMQHQFQFDNTDKILQKTPISFDPSVWEILMPFYSGCQLIIAPAGSHIDPEGIIDLIITHQITTIQLVPSILKQFLNSTRIRQCRSLRRVFVGGESLRPEIKKLFFETLACDLINLYGPTETTIDITYHHVTPSDSDINTNIIGKPISNTSLYVINEQHNLASIGEEGELYIGSFNISDGYHNRALLTQKHFIDNPFEPNKFKKIYKTGDLARWLPTGELEYLGRNNDQVKINGVRIEPKELILSILQHKEVSDCIVVKKIDSHGHDYLACYLTQKAHKKLNLSAIKNGLKSKFPIYMIPKIYMPIKHIPLTVNGKVDIDRLPEPDFKKAIVSANNINTLHNDEYELLLIWQMVLETNQIGLHDNFFDAGGGSLLALKLITLIQEKFHIVVRIREIFSYPTIKEQVHLIKNNRLGLQEINISPPVPNPVICLQRKGDKRPLFLIHPIGGTVFWFSQLSKLLGVSRPVYGIQDPSIDLEKPVLNSIEEMAEFYLLHLKKIQPKGPYLIGGASFGATIAVEISHQLRRNAETASSIIVLDGWGIYPNTLLDDNYFRSSMLRQHAELLSDFKKYGLPPPEILFDIQWFRLNLLWKYQLKLIECPIALFKAAEVLPAFVEIDAPFNHWENFSNNKIITSIVPGNHESMFQEPHVHQLSAAITQYFIKNNL